MSTPAPASPTVVVVDDHTLVATSLVVVLNAAGLPAERGPLDASGLVASLRRREPGVVLLDLELGATPNGEERDGADLVPVCTQLGWSVVVLTGTRSRGRIGDAVARGAAGWLRKDTAPDDVAAACRRARKGPLLDERERAELVSRGVLFRSARAAALARLAALTPRERAVLAHLVAGRSAAEIARGDRVALTTVRTQIRAVLAKLGVQSQLEAVAVSHTAAAA